MGLFKALWDWLRGKTDKEPIEELKEILPEKPVLKAPLPPPIKKGTLEDIRDYCEEIRGTLRIYKQTCDKIAGFLWTYKKIVGQLPLPDGRGLQLEAAWGLVDLVISPT